MIPKIIHQIAPKNRGKWHPVWNTCHSSWKGDYTFILWNDSDEIDNFIKETFPERFDFYQSLPLHIMKLDYVRYALLYEYGGIYADMDVYFYEDFYENLKSSICLLEPMTFLPDTNQVIMQCLMASSAKNSFWLSCMNECEKKTFVPENVVYSEQVMKNTGPGFLYEMYLKYHQLHEIQLLPSKYYHPSPVDYYEGMKTKHMKTQIWGSEAMDQLKIAFQQRQLNYQEGLHQLYKDIRGIDLNYYDYNIQFD
jgi:mannosyltransferase OCH1-like enzyme